MRVRKRRASMPGFSPRAWLTFAGGCFALLVCVGGYHLLSFIGAQGQECDRKARELAVVEHQIQELTAQNLLLERRRQRLRTQAGIEEVAREKLGMIRRGEIAYMVEPAPPALSPDTARVSPQPSEEMPEGVLGRLFGGSLF